MKKIYLLFAFFLLCLPGKAENLLYLKDKAFNFGGKVGFNATFPIVNSLSVYGVEATDIRVEYKVGYIAAVFCRVNIERFFLQPSLAWHRSEGEIHFNIPEEDITNGVPDINVIDPKNDLNMKTSSLELPILVGYNFVKEGPYGLSLMLGPKLKYNYKVAYTSNIANASPHEYISDSTPFGINLSAGLGVSIGRLFFDFAYEFGLNEVESDFKDKDPIAPSEKNNIRIDKRTNVMSFSLGFLF